MNTRSYLGKMATVVAAIVISLSGCKQKEEAPAAGPGPATAPSKPAIVSAEKNSFQEVTSKLDPGGNFYLYISTEQFLSKLSNSVTAASNLISSMPRLPDDAKSSMGKVFTVASKVVEDSGLSHVSGLGMSSIAREPGLYYNKFILHHYAGQDQGFIWSLFGKSPHPLKILDFLPASTALASSADFDLPMLWTNIQEATRSLDNAEVNSAMSQVSEKYREATGLGLDETLKSLGGEYGVVLTLDTNKTVNLPLGGESLGIPDPGLCLIFKVNSDLVFNRVDAVLEAIPGIGKLVIKTDEPGLKMRTVPLPIPLPIELHPSIARVDDYLLVASSDSLIREMVAVKSGQKKGFKSTEAFKKLSQGVPENGNNFSLVGSVLVDTIQGVQQKAMAKANVDTEAINNLHRLFHPGTNFGSYSVGLNDTEGWEGVGNSVTGGAQLAAIPAMFVAGTLAAVAIPSFVKARETAQKNVCINNLRVIDASKQEWALEKKKQSTDTPTMDDLLPYIGLGANAKPPVCPGGGVYTIGAVGEKPSCSVHGREP